MQSQSHYTAYQKRCQEGVPSRTVNLRTMPKKRTGKGSCTKRPFRDEKGIAMSKHLRKAEARLLSRRQAHAAIYNSNGAPPPGAYKKPGSMR